MQIFLNRLKAVRASNLIFAALLLPILYFIFTQEIMLKPYSNLVEDKPLTLLYAFLLSTYWLCRVLGSIKSTFFKADIKTKESLKAIFIENMLW